MKKKQYLYAIAFCHEGGQGCVQMTRNRKITTLEDFNDVLQVIKDRNNLNHVVIMNIMLLGKVKVN